MKRTIQLEDESYQIRFSGLVRGTCPVCVSFGKLLNSTKQHTNSCLILPVHTKQSLG